MKEEANYSFDVFDSYTKWRRKESGKEIETEEDDKIDKCSSLKAARAERKVNVRTQNRIITSCGWWLSELFQEEETNENVKSETKKQQEIHMTPEMTTERKQENEKHARTQNK